MGIFFNFLPDGSLAPVNEFEADGEKSEDVNDADYDDNGTDEGSTEEDNSVEGGEGEDTSENNDEEQDDVNEDDYTQGDEDDEGDDENTEENEDGEDEQDDVNEDDYTMSDEDDEGGEESSEDSEGDEDMDDESSDDSSDEERDSKLKELEGQLFDTLSPEQKQIKIDELKRCYEELYTRCDNIIKMINDANAPDESASKVFEYLNDNLTDLKQYIYDYFTYTFDTKTYLDNDAQYRKYLAILNSFNSILEELVKNKEAKSNK